MDENSRIEQSRKDLDTKLKGYQHPEVYKPYTREKQEYNSYSLSGDDPYKPETYDPYGTFTGDTSSRAEKCPVCDNPATLVCECEFKDLMCKNNHVWYTDKGGKIIIRDPHEDD